MTKEEFEQYYCDNCGVSMEFYKNNMITSACDCDDPDCKGWVGDPISNEAYEHLLRSRNPYKNMKITYTGECKASGGNGESK